MAQPKTSTLKVGILATISLGLLLVVLLWLRGRGIDAGVPYTVTFKDVDGMREGAAVQIMGIRVGFVDQLKPIEKDDKYYVQVAFTINNKEVDIPEGSRLSIEQSGIIGEKFLEITPPQLMDVTMVTFRDAARGIKSGIPVKFLYEEGLVDVGTVEKVERAADENMVRNKLYYRVTLPGAELPRDPIYELNVDEQGKFSLIILPTEPVLAKKPDPTLDFTIENPLRIKRFLEIQMDSAEALKLTNDRINQLLSDETIATMGATLKNTEVLTARATDVLDSADNLFRAASGDLEKLVATSDRLSKNLVTVTDNLNSVIGNPDLQKDIVSTVSSIEKSTKALSDILEDPALKETLAMTRDTTKEASALMASLRKFSQDKELQTKLDTSLTLLNTSLSKLTVVLNTVDEATDGEDKALKKVIDDAQETTENLKKFSRKLNGRFSLFRLMF